MSNEIVVVPSAVSASIARSGAKSSSETLAHETMHNLQYQHGWTELKLHVIVTANDPPVVEVTPATSPLLPPLSHAVLLISGLPTRHGYTHPDFLNHLIKNKLEPEDIPIQQEWVLPATMAEKYSLRKFCHVFDHLPPRSPLRGAPGFKHRDTKRILCGMKSQPGMGGDGTIVYYVMQEGEVKPRQN